MDQGDAHFADLLMKWQAGDVKAERQAVAFVYDELRQIAKGYLMHERPDHTLQPTAVVHEAILRLVREKPPGVRCRTHLLGVAARLMRQVLINYAHARRCRKRGNEWTRIPLHPAQALMEERSIDLTALDEALQELARIDPRQALIVELRFFGCLTIEETAQLVNVSPRTVAGEWSMARAWLRREIESK